MDAVIVEETYAESRRFAEFLPAVLEDDQAFTGISERQAVTLFLLSGNLPNSVNHEVRCSFYHESLLESARLFSLGERLLMTYRIHSSPLVHWRGIPIDERIHHRLAIWRVTKDDAFPFSILASSTNTNIASTDDEGSPGICTCLPAFVYPQPALSGARLSFVPGGLWRH